MATSRSPSSSSAPFINVCNKELSEFVGIFDINEVYMKFSKKILISKRSFFALMIGIKDFYPVYDKVRLLSAHWKSIAISFRLRIDTINAIEASSYGNTISSLQKVLEHWLKKDYDDYQTNGIPCWRRVCVAVREGGGDPALADEIAREHPLPAMRPAGSTSSKERSITPVMNDVAMSPASTDRATGTSKYGSSEKSFELTSKLYDLQDEFDEAIRITKKSFKSSDLPEIIDYLITHTMSLLGPNKKQQTTAEAVREEFKNIQKLSELFTVLQDKYISWFNYKLMIKLVGVFLPKNRSLKRTWSSYEEKLKDYFINSGGLLKDADAVQFGVKGVPPGTRVMIAKVDRDDYTLDDIFFFRRAIPKGLDIPEYDLYFSFVYDGSLCLGYLIPEYLYSLLFPLTTKLQQQLASIGITELTCGEDKYDLREFSIEEVKHSSTDIDICDPLWYENTSTPLHEAAWRGLKDEVQWLLDKFGYSTNHRGLHGWTPLHSASYGGHIEILQILIDQYGIDPNEGDDNSVSSIHMASYKGHLSIVQYLVDTCDVPPDQPDNSNNTALLYSAMGGHCDLVEFFIERNCNTSQINCISASLSLLACKSGELALVHKLESLNLFSPDDTTKSGAGILHYTCCSMNNKSIELFKYLLKRYHLSIEVKDQYGNLDLVQLLIQQYKLEPFNHDKYGFTALHAAAERGHTYILEWYSLEYSVDITNHTSNNKYTLAHSAAFGENHELDLCAVNDEGMAPIHLACSNGRLNLIQYIIEHIPSSLELPHSKDSRTPLLIAVYFNQLEVIKYLISKKCNLSATDDEGSGAVHISVARGHLNVLKYLIDNNYCNPNATNHQDRTPLHVAVAAEQFEILEYLLEMKLSLLFNVQDKDGNTPLHFACRRRQQKMASLLIRSTNINLLITNKKGQTPLHLAAASGHKDTAEALLFSVTGSSTHHDLLTATDNEGSTVLHTACSNGHTDVFRYLSSIYPQGVNVMDNKGRGLLHAAFLLPEWT
ncbi:PREDICTED: serine/threonine-protein phosphatase 6 regulatory ankyrin repeat subunit B-like [Amphimedon queenslandica]|uniref:Death domain-containing protein n=1 Tax=Amphimedon queenslandica TaxID=400682 RepID=A0AAN0JNB1_AMPQE|nr:PREDICTED: serine/threonine-protein phosphatase 6 regulatory ankyrin repeat subunit B-like [Amphimedon queenslandica]|eukprot:XP_019858301.1 PREDICTED: serine/threonine-protein phosphatase 6 regulatory ankyrin repeat subunit B-like [Amphimedon queenslandica]